MSIVSKTSAYPATVKPGIPKLPAQCPVGWSRKPLSNYLHETRRPIKMLDRGTYRLVTVKRARGGVVVREELTGSNISVKSQFEIMAGDFIISKRQIVHGACGLVPAELEGSIVSNEYSVLRGNGDICLNYLNYLANSAYFQQTCFHSSIGVHVEKMIFKLDRWLSWNFLIPPLPEQKKIAKILSTWDRAIEVVEGLIENSQAQKKALMQQLLTAKKRLPGFDGEFTKLHFREVLDVDQNSLGKNTSTNFRFRYISLSDVSPSTISGDLKEIAFSEAPSRARRIVKTGDILVATVRPNLQAFAKINSNFSDCIASTGFAVLSAKKGYCPEYIYHYLFSDHITSQIDALVVGSNYPAINSSDVKGLMIFSPNLDEQIAIAKVLDKADNLVADFRTQLQLLQNEKSALMQQLLTGKRRVKIDKEAAA